MLFVRAGAGHIMPSNGPERHPGGEYMNVNGWTIGRGVRGGEGVCPQAINHRYVQFTLRSFPDITQCFLPIVILDPRDPSNCNTEGDVSCGSHAGHVDLRHTWENREKQGYPGLLHHAHIHVSQVRMTLCHGQW